MVPKIRKIPYKLFFYIPISSLFFYQIEKYFIIFFCTIKNAAARPLSGIRPRYHVHVPFSAQGNAMSRFPKEAQHPDRAI